MCLYGFVLWSSPYHTPVKYICLIEKNTHIAIRVNFCWNDIIVDTSNLATTSSNWEAHFGGILG